MMEYNKKFGDYEVYTTDKLSSSQSLIDDNFSPLGYNTEHVIQDNQIIINCSHKGEIVGTLIMSIDRANGCEMPCSEMYCDELRELESGHEVYFAELGRFAIKPHSNTRLVMFFMYHVIVIIGLRLHITDLVAEVIPRHAVAHKRLLGFELACSEQKYCERAKVHSVLLHRKIYNEN